MFSACEGWVFDMFEGLTGLRGQPVSTIRIVYIPALRVMGEGSAIVLRMNYEYHVWGSGHSRQSALWKWVVVCCSGMLICHPQGHSQFGS